MMIGGSYWLVKQKSLKNSGLTALRDGEYLGHIHQIDAQKMTLAFNEAVLLTGKPGQDAAIEAGHCTEKTRAECLPNDYFIKNIGVSDQIISISQNAHSFMQTWKMEETGKVMTREIKLSDLAELINNPSLHWQILPFNITIQNGEITHIEELYIP